MTHLMTGDTIDLSDADFTIISYVDSAGCTPCKMKLPLWKEFINSFDSVTEASVTMLMIVNPTDEREVSYALKRDSYNYPVYIDSTDHVNLKNRLPEVVALRTFLLDRSHGVIAIGHPLAHPGIATLYRSIISGQYSLSLSLNAIVSIDRNSIDFGTVPAGEERTGHFKIINGGNDTVFIRKVMTSCHCTEALIAGGVIPPNSHIDGEVKFLGDSVPGDFNNSLHIFYDGFDYPSVIQIYGTIE